MSITYNRDGSVTKPKPPLMLALMTVNVAYSLAVLCAWTYISNFVTDPIAWATWKNFYRGGTIHDLFVYPFSMLWQMPLAFVAVGWLAEKSGSRSLAWTCISLPIVMHTLVIGWFYLAPLEWR